MQTTFIYALSDPRNGIPRYIGKSNNPQNRLRSHINKVNKNTHRDNWIKSLLKENIIPELWIVDEVPMSEWEFWEEHYGHLYLSWGFDMVFDRRYLGVGTGHLNRIQIQNSKNRKPMSERGKANIREAVKKRDKNPTPALLENWRKFKAGEYGVPSRMKGKKVSDATKKKMSDAKKGDKAFWFGKKLSPETIEKLRINKLGKKQSADTSSKKSASLKKAWAEGRFVRKKKGDI